MTRRMLIHSVYFWFRSDADAALVARFEHGLARLTTIPDIHTAHFGRPEATPKRPDIEAHDRYQAHPIHQEFLDEFAASWQRVQVYDVRA
jgi:Stress responsive A/B Barrel Domain